jgi:hypothetical protein
MEPKNASKTLFSEQFRKVFDSGSHADVKFLAGVDREEIKAHKVILSSRSAYFQAMFREDNVMIENREGVIVTPHEPRIFRKLLEFIYTDNVEGLDVCDSDELVELMMTANQIKVAQMLLAKTLPDIPKLTAGGSHDANPELPGGRLVAWEEEPAVLAAVPAEPAPAPAPPSIFDEVPLYVVSKPSRAGQPNRVTPLDLASEAEPLEPDAVRDGSRDPLAFDLAF